MIAFLVAAAGLVAVTLLLVLRPWTGAASRAGAVAQADAVADADAGAGDGADALAASAADEVAAVNRRVHRDALRELRRDHAAGLLSDADLPAAQDDLARRLLEDMPAGATRDPVADRPGARTPVVLAIAIPLLAVAGYAWRGHPEAIQGEAGSRAMSVAAPGPAPTSAPTMPDVDAMLARLAARLQAAPDDPAGWTMLARAYRAQGRAREARAAFEHIGPTLQQDATLLAQYADTLAATDGGHASPAANDALTRALALDGDNAMALSLSATLAFNAHDLPRARQQWTHLLRVLPPESPDAGMVRAMLGRLPAPSTTTAAAAAGTASASAPAPASTSTSTSTSASWPAPKPASPPAH